MGEDGMRWVGAITGWTQYLAVSGYCVRTIELRGYQLRRLAEANLRRSPWRVTKGELVDWLAAQDWSAESRRSYRSALRSFYGWGVEAGHTRRNPAARLPAVRAPHGLPRPTPEPVALVALASASDRDRLILALATYAGMRRAEIAGLKWAAITEDGIRVVGKGGRVRVVPVHPTLCLELDAEWYRRRILGTSGTGYRYTVGLGGPWIFPGQGGGPMTPDAVGRAASRALGDGWGAHSLRHRFATRAYTSTHDLLAVQTLLGHAKPETTRRYTELGADALVAAVHSI